MKLCSNCDETTIICDFCIYSKADTECKVEEILWCEKLLKGVDPCDDGCEEFHCSLAEQYLLK